MKFINNLMLAGLVFAGTAFIQAESSRGVGFWSGITEKMSSGLTSLFDFSSKDEFISEKRKIEGGEELAWVLKDQYGYNGDSKDHLKELIQRSLDGNGIKKICSQKDRYIGYEGGSDEHNRYQAEYNRSKVAEIKGLKAEVDRFREENVKLKEEALRRTEFEKALEEKESRNRESEERNSVKLNAKVDSFRAKNIELRKEILKLRKAKTEKVEALNAEIDRLRRETFGLKTKSAEALREAESLHLEIDRLRREALELREAGAKKAEALREAEAKKVEALELREARAKKAEALREAEAKKTFKEKKLRDRKLRDRKLKEARALEALRLKNEKEKRKEALKTEVVLTSCWYDKDKFVKLKTPKKIMKIAMTGHGDKDLKALGMLLRKKEAFRFQCEDGKTLVMHAILNKNGDRRIFGKLVHCKHFDLNAQDNNGNTALMLLFMQENSAYSDSAGGAYRHSEKEHIEDLVHILLSNDTVDINKQNNDGKTAIMIALEQGKLEILTSIGMNNQGVFQRVKKTLKDKKGRTVYDIIEELSKQKERFSLYEQLQLAALRVSFQVNKSKVLQYLEVLGLKEGADKTAIHKAYRRESAKNHPDKSNGCSPEEKVLRAQRLVAIQKARAELDKL